MKAISILVGAFFLVLFLVAPSLAQAPWEVNDPIVTVQKELYAPSPAPGVCQWCWSYYVGPDGQLVENYVEESAATGDDVHMNPRRRFSNDNGQTWSSFESMPPIASEISGVRVQDGRGERPFYDPVAGVVVRFSQQYANFGDYAYNHTFYDISDDYGHTYGPRSLVTYEPGGEYHGDPIETDYLQLNNAYPGNNTIRQSNGTIVTAISETYVTMDGQRQPYATRCLIGTWDAGAHDYDWVVGAPTYIPSGAGFHGLYESQVAELKDGRLLLTWRTDSGYRYYGTSTDGGLTVSSPTELRYDDGTRFYSPSSISNMIRSSDTGKLYFIGNITTDPPSGNLPRYPLVIAEIDETGTPAIKKDTVTLIDTRQAGEESSIQLSNFSLFENKATQQIIMHVSPLGYIGGYEAPVRKYTLTFQPSGAAEPIYREIFPNVSGVPAGLTTTGWFAHGGSDATQIGTSSPTAAVTCAASDGGPALEAINSNPSTGDTIYGYTFHKTSMIPTGEPQILWTDEYVVNSSNKLTEARWEQLMDNTTLTPSIALKVGNDWFVTNQTGTIEDTAPLFDVVSLDLANATWSALDFDPGHSLAKGDSVSSLPDGNILAFGLYIDETPSYAYLRFDNFTLLAGSYISGDLNGDGYVGAADFDIVRAHWGQHVTAGSRRHGDPSGDGFVSVADLDIVRANWGKGVRPAPEVPPGAVPEPSVLVALCGAALVWLLGSASGRRRRPSVSRLWERGRG